MLRKEGPNEVKGSLPFLRLDSRRFDSKDVESTGRRGK